jgi:hypothetical protein
VPSQKEIERVLAGLEGLDLVILAQLLDLRQGTGWVDLVRHTTAERIAEP